LGCSVNAPDPLDKRGYRGRRMGAGIFPLLNGLIPALPVFFIDATMRCLI